MLCCSAMSFSHRRCCVYIEQINKYMYIHLMQQQPVEVSAPLYNINSFMPIIVSELFYWFLETGGQTLEIQ